MFGRVRDRVWESLVSFLVSTPKKGRLSPNDFDVIRARIQPGDVLLVEGQTRVGAIIKNITRSSWSHAAICIGPLNEIDELGLRQRLHEFYSGPDDEPLLIEAEIDRGTAVTPLSFYKDFHVRIARPIGLSEIDTKRITAFMVNRLGSGYDVKQLLDLARFLLPWWSLVPRRWYSSLFETNAGEATRNVCSSLIAKAFQSVGFPILPLIEREADGRLRFYPRNPKLFTPRDFDYSPFFKIIKYPLLSETPSGYYRSLNWSEFEENDKERVNYMSSEDLVFVSSSDTQNQQAEAPAAPSYGLQNPGNQPDMDEANGQSAGYASQISQNALRGTKMIGSMMDRLVNRGRGPGLINGNRQQPEPQEKLWGDEPDRLQSGLKKITDRQLRDVAESFYQNGYVKLPGAVDHELCDAAIEAYQEWVNVNSQSMEGIRPDGRNPRVVNLHVASDAQKRLFSASPRLLSALDTLFGYPACVYTSLSFQYGTEQPLHRDTPVFRTAPEEFYFGVWIALEDATLENGCLKALEGGHRGGRVDPYAFAEQRFDNLDEIPVSGAELWSPYQDAVVEQCRQEGRQDRLIEASKGDVVVWHPQLPHGGSAIKNPDKTRMSMVYHVVPRGVPVFQADIFFNRHKKDISNEKDIRYVDFEGRSFMEMGMPTFGSN